METRCGMEEQEAEQQPPPEQQGKKLKVKTRGLLTPSRSNEGEALVAAAHVRALIETAGLKPEEIAVITPYNAQVGPCLGADARC